MFPPNPTTQNAKLIITLANSKNFFSKLNLAYVNPKPTNPL